MNEAEELAMLRRMAELEAKAGGLPQTEPQGEPSIETKIRSTELGRIAQGMADPMMGMAQLASHGLGYLTSLGGITPNRVSEFFDEKSPQINNLINENEAKYAEAKKYQESQDPWLKITGKPDPNAGLDLARVAGNVISPMNRLFAKALPISPEMTTGQKIVQSGTAGGIGAAAQPIIEMEPGQSYGTTKAVQTGLGAITSGALSPILSKVGANIVNKLQSFDAGVRDRAAQNVDSIIASELKSAGQKIEDIPSIQLDSLRKQVSDSLRAGKPLDPAALLRKQDFEAMGTQGTKGQITREPMQFAKERNLRGVSGVGEPLTGRFTEQNQILQRTLSGASEGAQEAYPAGVKLSDALKSFDKSMQKKVSELYNEARQSSGKDLNVPLEGVAQDYAETLRNFGDKVPSGVRNRFEELGLLSGNQKKVFTIEDAESILKTINDNKTNDRATNTALDALGKSIKNAVISADDQGGVFAVPRAAAAKRFKLHEAIPALEDAANGTTAPDDFVKKFIINGKTENVQGLAELLRKTNAEAFDEAKAQIGNKLKEAAFGQNVTGDKIFTPERYAKALKDIGTEKLKAFFVQDEIDQLKRAGRVGAYINTEPAAAAVNKSNSASAVANVLSKIPGIPASAALLGAAGRTIGNTRAVNTALDSTIPEQAAKLTPEQIQFMSRLLSIGAQAIGAGAGSTLR